MSILARTPAIKPLFAASHRHAQRLHLGDAVHHAGVLGGDFLPVLLDGGVQLALRLRVAGGRLRRLGAGVAAVEQREADLNAGHARAVVLADGRGRLRAGFFRLHEAFHGGQMPGARFLHLALGDLQRLLAGADLRALLARQVQPGRRRSRLGLFQQQAWARRQQTLRLGAGQVGQLAQVDLKLALRFDALRLRQIQARLRLVDIGDGAVAGLERTLRQRQLALQRGGLLVRQLDVFLCQQYVHIGLQIARGRVILLAAEHGVAVGGARLALLVLIPAAQVEDRLAQAQRAVGAAVAKIILGVANRRALAQNVE